ncbi:MAG: Smr/MutS family protein [Methyloceanibacter sp.]|uniref:Smr/MutS family protein n=1 Tax=Methyloceanibacter sp. TaxID=1965321 RepID=UPI003D6D2C5A
MGKRDSGKHDQASDDGALWARVAKSAIPLKPRKKNRVVEASAPPKPPTPPKKKPPRIAVKPAPKPEARPKPSHAPAAGLDRQTARKLERGRLAVEARLDLHGMRQRDAHAALRKFLKWARGKDYRHVLVITGKGAMADEPKSFYEEDARGVLRQAVPHWLSHGDLAPLIVSFAEAPRRLGGEGALYVRLRRKG